MNRLYVSIVITLLSIQLIYALRDDPEKLSACKAKITSTGEIIDLSSLDNPDSPRTVNYGSQTYKFNPCSGYSCGKSNTVAVIIIFPIL